MTTALVALDALDLADPSTDGTPARPLSVVVTLSDDQLDRLADRLAERLVGPPVMGLVDASTLARRLGVSRATVYEHASELGAIEVGGGTRPRLRFDAEKAAEAWTRRSVSGRSQRPETRISTGQRTRQRGIATGNSAPLLPIRGQEAA